MPRSRGDTRADAGAQASAREREVIFVRPRPRCPPPPGPPQPHCRRTAHRASREAAIDEEADDVIDLGAPRPPRRRPPAPRPLPPNPRLYPGPKPSPAPAPDPRGRRRGRRRPRALRRPVPNSRLYRPGPPRRAAPPPPPAWPPPAPPRALDTASRAALRLRSPPAPPPARAPSPRLVVTLPEVTARYRATSEHFRARAGAGSGDSTPPAARLSAPVMERPSASTSPEDRSDGNDPLSAPSEFLAEFLSAIMRRQYAEALKYCRLILQYEPHNATARGFYPLLRHKLARHQRTEEAAAADSADSSGDEEAPAPRSAGESPSHREELMELSTESGDGDGDCGESEESAAGEHSDLELDSSSALHSSPSLSLSRRTGRSDRTDDSTLASASASGGAGESSGSASRSDAAGPEPDDNGNIAAARARLLPGDLENENAAAGGEPHLTTDMKSESQSVSSLRRLRAQFACSIK